MKWKQHPYDVYICLSVKERFLIYASICQNIRSKYQQKLGDTYKIDLKCSFNLHPSLPNTYYTLPHLVPGSTRKQPQLP